MDSLAMEIQLPQDKFKWLKEELSTSRGRKACKAVRAGRSFLRRLIDLSMIPHHLDHYVHLSMDARSDIEWWAQYVESWNGIQMMRAIKGAAPAAVMTSDASGGWGCGAYAGPHLVHTKVGGSHFRMP